jgi:prepilin-type N-terminal cleavage/methylation domain-containing protein
MKAQDGITLIELVVVIGIITLLLAIGFSFQGWLKRYNVEKTIRELQTDLQLARQKALSEKRVYCVNLSQNSYTIRADDYPPPDGDGKCTENDKKFIEKTGLRYNIINNLGDSFKFDKEGLTDKNGHIRIDEEAYINCINVFSTRLNLGEFKNGSCVSK